MSDSNAFGCFSFSPGNFEEISCLNSSGEMKHGDDLLESLIKVGFLLITLWKPSFGQYPNS